MLRVKLTSSSGDMMGRILQYCRSEQLLVFLAISWKIKVLCRAGEEVAVVCNPIRMGSSSRWGSFFDVVDSGLRVQLTEL